MYPVKLMSFNIDGDRADREVTRLWDNRSTICSEILLRYKANLIGFQEVQTKNRITLDDKLSKFASEYGVRTIHQADEHTSYNPIYWNSELYEKLDGGGFYLSQTPNKWSISWDAMHVRSATWVHLRCVQTDVTFIFMNVHLDHRGSQARIESSKLLISQLMRLRQLGNLTAIISGDFNSRAWSPINENPFEYPPPVLPEYLPPGGIVHRIYTEQNFRDVYLDGGNKNQLSMNTYHDYYGDAFPSVALRIDWILTLNGKHQINAKNYMLIRDSCPPIYASDHYPIMAELEWC